METLLLLHGAIGSAAQLDSLQSLFSSKFNVLTMNFSGHGGLEMPESFSIELFAVDVLQCLENNKLESVHIFGYSMGGYVALYLARHYPEKIQSVATLATKFHWDKSIAAKEVKMLDPVVIEQKIPKFAEQLAARHTPVDWKLVLQKTAMMLTRLGESNVLDLSDYSRIGCPVIIMLGDRDKMVTLDETVNVFKALPHASFAVLPNTSHPIEHVDDQMLFYHLERFFTR